MLFSIIAPVLFCPSGFAKTLIPERRNYTELDTFGESFPKMNSELENILISSNKAGMISYLKSNPEKIDEAVDLAVSDKQPFSWRAASLLSSYMDINDVRIQKHVNRIVDVLLNANDGHQRELLKILFNINLKKEHEGILFNKCMTLWESINKQPSVRITAFKFIIKIVKKHPELYKEILFLTQDHYLNTLSPGVKKSIYKMIKDFQL